MVYQPKYELLIAVYYVIHNDINFVTQGAVKYAQVNNDVIMINIFTAGHKQKIRLTT